MRLFGKGVFLLGKVFLEFRILNFGSILKFPGCLNFKIDSKFLSIIDRQNSYFKLFG